MRVTIAIEEGEAGTVVAASEGGMAEAQTRTEQVSAPEPIDGGPARATVELEGAEMELTGGLMEGSQEGRGGPIDAGPAPVLAMDGDAEGPLPLGRSQD